MKHVVSAIVSCLLLCSIAGAEDSVAVTGAIQKPGEWTVARIKSELAKDVTTISYAGHDGKKHKSTAVPLLAVLRATGLTAKLQRQPSADPKVKHWELRLAVAVKGRDGYVAAFSLSELQTDVGNQHVWLALDADGQDLPATDGPMKLIAPDDQKPARWVHGVTSIAVIDLAAASTQPASK